jgi:hypothetical protein
MHAYEMSYKINVNSTPPTQLPHKFSYIVAIFIHNHFESPSTYSVAKKYGTAKYFQNGLAELVEIWHRVRSV